MSPNCAVGRLRDRAVEWAFGTQAGVQHCQLHKRQDVKVDLREHCRAPSDRQIRAACAMAAYAKVQLAPERFGRQLCDVNPSAARSLE